MLAKSAWTRYTETQWQSSRDVPECMPEGCPGIIVAMQSTSRTEDRFHIDNDKYGIAGIA